MACDVTVRTPGSAATRTIDAVIRALALFVEMEKSCTRFDPTSPLMRANADGLNWVQVPPVCFDALVEAYRAHSGTEGVFDPRVLADLVSLGYDASLRFTGPVGPGSAAEADDPAPTATAAVGRWQPGFRRSELSVQIGPRPVDLGGIGKGLAVRWAAQALAPAAPDVLVAAGGDSWCGGNAPGGGPWLVGVEDPAGGEQPLAVLGLSDRACGTSSTRVRRWRARGRDVHHLIDPSTGRPGGEGLAAVTVVGADPAEAEVWAKVLFLAGRERVADRARALGLAALWVDADGSMATSPAMEPYVVWRAA